MALRHYTENYNGWVAPDAGSIDTWVAYDLTPYGVPPSALVEIAIDHPRTNANYWGGVRQIGSSLDRRIQLEEAEGAGSHICTMLVQADSSGYIEYYSDWWDFLGQGFPATDTLNFYIVGWWLGCEYVEKIETFAPTSSGSWEGYALDQYGVSGSQIADIVMTNTAVTSGLEMGVRASGSSLERKFRLKEAEATGGKVTFSISVMASGNTAAVDLYAEETSSSLFYLLGYFTGPPGEYVEKFVLFPNPATSTTWESLDVGSSGIHNNSVVHFAAGNHDAVSDFLANEIGFRQTSSTLDRTLDLDESEEGGTTTGKTWGSIVTNVDSSGYLEYYAERTNLDPDVVCVGYWTNFLNSNTPFPFNGSIDLFLSVLNPFTHYVETMTTPEFHASPTGTWVEYDLLTNHNIPASTEIEPIVAEVVIRNDRFNLPYSGGARSVGSSLDRRFNIHDAASLTNARDFLSILTPVNSDGKIEIYSTNTTYIDFFVIGYWVGGIYVDHNEKFQASGDHSWINYDLGSDYADKVAEVAITNINASIKQSGGIREVGSSNDRYHDISRGDSGPDHVTMHVNASGANGTIQIYASSSGDITFTSLGLWSQSPGIYNEIFAEIGPVTVSNIWQKFNTSGTVGSVAEIVIENRDQNGDHDFGVRQIGSSTSRTWSLRPTDAASSNLDADMIRVFTNTLAGISVELLAEQHTEDNRFMQVGYWDNFSLLPTTVSGTTNLFIEGIPASIDSSGQYPSGVPLFIYGVQIGPPLDLFMDGIGFESLSGTLYVFGVNVFRTDSEFSATYPSGVSLFTDGTGTIAESGQFNLFTNGMDNQAASGDLFTSSFDNITESENLFMKTIEPINSQITLYLHIPVDSVSGLIADTNAVFYLSRRHGNVTNTITELVENIVWDFPSLIIGNEVFLDQSGATTTVGDGTLPQYNDMGGGFSSSRFGFALVGSLPQQQNVMGHVTSPADYPDVGSGNITTAFWMSGAKTSGNIVDAGWFTRGGDFGNTTNATKIHTVGIKITSGNGLQVLTSVSSSDDQWTEVSIAHNDIVFFVVRAEFIASGIDPGFPDHMKIYLSVDGQPWVSIGSGATSPPGSSLANAVGLQVQAINNDFDEESIIVNEIVLWKDSDRFNNDELSNLYDVVSTYFRPLDEYKPTFAPFTTYINRTVGQFSIEPVVSANGFNPGEIVSGLLVTLEVGIGGYGEDASAYLLEETPPSGFIIQNIIPHADVTYPNQGSRPATQQQIFHDTQSGIMEPYDNTLGVNAYGASIRWINHDNHPQKDERRLPTPTGIYTYALFPVSALGAPPVSDFEFRGSGLFFGGSTGSGTFVVNTTQDTSGTTSGLTGGILSAGFALYVSGPTEVSGNIGLYLRTQENFTSAFIGTSQRTPEAVDFIFEADGNANIQFLPGIQYGPDLVVKGPLQYENSMTMVLFGPAADEITLFIHGWDSFNTSGAFPSGMLMKTGDGHEPLTASGDFFMVGPLPHSGDFYMHTRAGAFEPPIDLFTIGHILYSDSMSGYIKGPEFIVSSGSFAYPGNIADFTFPYGDPSPSLYMGAFQPFSGSISLHIGPTPNRLSWTLYLKTEDSDINDTANLFIHGFTPSSSGANQTFNNMPMYIEAADADFPYTAGGTTSWTMFLKAQSGNLTNDEAWTMFLKADSTTTETLTLNTYGHASGEAPHGNEISGSITLVCSVDPDDPSRIGYIPFDSDVDPWTLFLKVDPGHFNTSNLYISGAIPVTTVSSGNLFIEGLFEQETSTVTLYLLGISGIINNGPGGLHLFLDVGILVYNNSGNLYLHGY